MRDHQPRERGVAVFRKRMFEEIDRLPALKDRALKSVAIAGPLEQNLELDVWLQGSAGVKLANLRVGNAQDRLFQVRQMVEYLQQQVGLRRESTIVGIKPPDEDQEAAIEFLSECAQVVPLRSEEDARRMVRESLLAKIGA